MLDVHAPHAATHSWRDFFIHIATITVGLVIAVGLEQTVEAIQHQHQRQQLEEKLRGELRANLKVDEADFRTFADIRAYLVELKAAVSAHRHGVPQPAAPPPATDTRRQRIPIMPSVAVWDAAKLDATITLLPSREISTYSGAILQHDLLLIAVNDYQHSAFALESFEERFVDSPGAFDMGSAAPPLSLDTMTPAELMEYESLLATYIKSIDRSVMRIRFFDVTARAILDGANSREEVRRRLEQATGMAHAPASR
ncbi:MAG: hypothetical protein WBY53_02535 [Acidobacteriaceae bacterium]